MSYDSTLKLNHSEIQEIIKNLRSGKSVEYNSEPDMDPYGSGAYDKSTLSYDIETQSFILKFEFWASQYNSEPEVTFFHIDEKKVTENLLTVNKSRLREL